MEIDTDEMIRNWRIREAQRDRVSFTIPASYSSCHEHPRALGDVLARAFGLPACTARHSAGRPITIICRADQFGRFIILRNEAGIANGIKELNARLLDTRPACGRTFDVTQSR